MVLGEEIVTGRGSSTTVADHIDGAKDDSSTTVEAEEISESTITDHGDDEDQKKLSVLIVDDSSLIRLLHMTMVTRAGMEAQLAEDGKKAVDLHRSRASFDLILMDMEMPVMNGVEATRELRAMGVETMIVGVTSNSEGPERQAFVEAGLNDCYTKPLNDDKVAALVQAIKETNIQKTI
ncbi:Two-component response regulator [Morus notabilis]|uniref:Two-component response regulator n=1 Tax=Morus notabilis TaxID=981085 RepID=W9RHG6_9ROSA|nr:two-component response regulator ARR22 [Morus notabilis]EXB93126.1 Two-component response regulator [Morus notabilis]